MDLNKHHKIAEFLTNEFDDLKSDANAKKVKINFYKQRKLKGKIEKLLLKVDSILLKVDSLEEKTIEEDLKNTPRSNKRIFRKITLY